MDANRFTDQKLGRLTPTTTGRGADVAFVPDPLPLDWTLPAKTWPLLVNAREAIARLDGVGRHMPSPEILLRPLQRREAIRSSSLEGTYATPEELLLFEIEPREPGSRNDPANAWKEVFNYANALTLGQQLLKEELPLSLRLIRRLHERLMEGVRGNDSTPGEFRRVQVQIGADARFVPPPPQEVMPGLDAFEKYLHTDTKIDPLVRCFMVHYQFEAIHPFTDGNGRVGRLLLALMTCEWLGLNRPWLYLSPYFERYKDDYIDKLFRVSTHGDWSGWVDFCLAATIDQATDAMARIDKLIALKEKYQQTLREFSGAQSARLFQIIDQLFSAPAVTAPQLQKLYAVTYPTARADIENLVGAKILTAANTPKRPRIYYAPEIIEIAHSEPTGVMGAPAVTDAPASTVRDQARNLDDVRPLVDQG